MTSKSYSSITAKQPSAYRTCTKVKILPSNGENCCSMVKVGLHSMSKHHSTFVFLCNADNALLYEYTDSINNDLASSSPDEMQGLYNNVFRYIYQAIQPLDYFSTELMAYIAVLTYLAKWPLLVRVCALHVWHFSSELHRRAFRRSFDSPTRRPHRAGRFGVRKIRVPAVVERLKTHSWAVCCPNRVYRRCRASRIYSSKSRER